METIIMIVGPALGLLITALVAWGLRKVGLSPEGVAMATEITQRALTRVEELVVQSGYKGPQKMQSALAIMDRWAKDHPEVRDYLATHGKALAEKVLRSTLTPDSMTPKDPTL